MKTEELRAQGLTDEQIKYVMKENGKDIAKLQSDIDTANLEKDKLQKQYDAATETLKKFEGVDVEGLKEEVSTWKKKAEDTEKEYTSKLYERDYNDALRAALDGSTLKKSKAIRIGIEKQIREADLKLKDGKILGLSDLLEQIKADDPDAFTNEDAKKGEAGKAKFTQQMDNNTGGGSNGAQGNAQTWASMTLDERIKLKNTNPERYAELSGAKN